MAKVLACDICGAVSQPGVLPPFVEPCRWSNAIEDYTVVLCRDCQLKPLPEILAAATGAPGGTVDGADRGPYLVVPPPEEPAEA